MADTSSIFCEQPLPAEQFRVYIYNVAHRLGTPINLDMDTPDGHAVSRLPGNRIAFSELPEPKEFKSIVGIGVSRGGPRHQEGDVSADLMLL